MLPVSLDKASAITSNTKDSYLSSNFVVVKIHGASTVCLLKCVEEMSGKDITESYIVVTTTPVFLVLSLLDTVTVLELSFTAVLGQFVRNTGSADTMDEGSLFIGCKIEGKKLISQYSKWRTIYYPVMHCEYLKQNGGLFFIQ